MSHPLHDFLNTELDPHLLAAPYRVQTNWHVISGAPSCGKTTIIDQLAERGYKTVAESARQYLDREMAKGRKLEEIYNNKDDARGIRNFQIRTEQDLNPNDRLFLDRGLPDCLAFCRTIGMDPNDFLAESFLHRYASVFILDRLPLELDGARLDDDPMMDYLDRRLGRDYAALGYAITRIPVMPPQERLNFVLRSLTDVGNVGKKRKRAVRKSWLVN